MRTKTTRIVRLPLTLLLLSAAVGAVAGCGGGEAAGHGAESRREDRARQVAEAWDGSPAARTWRAGYHPMGEAVQLPEGGFRAGADTRAFTTQNFVLRGTLPAAGQKPGEVRWKSGASLTLPLTRAREAYESVARGGNDGPRLTVTGARLGGMTLATSRGPATVPAWLFTLEGYDTPLRRAAVAPSKLPGPPVGPERGVPASELEDLAGLVEVSGDGRSVTVTAGHGACDDGPAVHVLETGGSVVLSAFVTGTREGACTSQMLLQEVTVKLARRVGDRVLLDAFTGRPVPYGAPNGRSPSWSR
ncbi:hypothetical protein [Streptomyces fagopyri]|uniref:hypothetical protein n=1 Tax=Streptomyces fagopyri TaxID=2662397 RepID=UPI003408580B